MATTFGWSSDAASCASRSMRAPGFDTGADVLAFGSGGAASDVRILSAIARFRRGSCARYTSPIPPEPSRLSMT
jgi:hypothetical protein